MALLKEKTVLDKNASVEELEDALSKLGPIKINQVVKALGLNPRGRKVQDIVEILTDASLEDAILAYNQVAKDMNNRREKVKDFFTKENIEDLFEDISEWILFALSLWNSRK